MTTPSAPAPVTPPSKGYKPVHGGYPTPKGWPFPARPVPVH